MSCFLGIDPGYGRTGYGIIENIGTDNRLSFTTAGVIETDKEAPEEYRLKEIYETVHSLLEKHQPAYAAVEQIFFRKNLTTGIRVIEARGIILLAFACHAVPFSHITPTAMKKMITGNGRSGKKQVQTMTGRLLNLQKIPGHDDAADALGLAFCAYLESLKKNKQSLIKRAAGVKNND